MDNEEINQFASALGAAVRNRLQADRAVEDMVRSVLASPTLPRIDAKMVEKYLEGRK